MSASEKLAASIARLKSIWTELTGVVVMVGRQPIAIGPAAAAHFNNLGSALHSAGQFEPAEAAYREALKARPNDLKATFGLHMAEGQKALDAKRYADAQKAFDDALKLFPIHR